MTLASFPRLRRLPKRQRLKLAEELWLSSIDDTAPVPPEHKKILDERWSAYRSGKVKPISMAELERRLARR
jgi:putative addiction module component (TIGR02574 family)